MKLLLILSLMVSPAAFAKAKAKKSKYPRTQAVQGKVVHVDESIRVVKRQPEKTQIEKPVKSGVTLKDKAHLKTGDDGELWIELSDNSTLVLLPKTEVQLPAIAWKDGGVSEIHLKSGSLRYICEAQCDRKLITPIYEGVPPVGSYVLNYDLNLPQAQLSVLKGEVPFRGIENEESVVLHAGEFATFKGVLENNEPAFDVLLKGRRVAKGTLSEVQKISPDELGKYEKQDQAHQKVQTKKKVVKRETSQICDKPWGELNQCVWICEKNKKKAKDCRINEGAQCVRMRCNANGQWADRLELSSNESKCQAKPVVGACDY